MQGNGGKILIVAILAAAGFGAYKYFTKNVGSKTDDELFIIISNGGMTATAAQAELVMRAGSGKTPATAFRSRLKDDNKDVRVAACKGIRACKDKASAPALIETLADDAFEVRTAACEAFENVRVKEAVAPLIQLLDDPKEGVRVAASSALRSITKQSYSNKESDKWKNWWTDNGKNFVVQE
ncbi:MAG: HEAT repeat domain-containing protein [Planctomycetes bacterium]|nr:HEAT repeat domain-containing protein [Planctomycetota bacterium]